jgi:hypothetical protein
MRPLAESPAIRDLRGRIEDAVRSEATIEDAVRSEATIVVVIGGASGDLITQLVHSEIPGINVVHVQIPTLRHLIVERMVSGGETFWDAAYLPFMARDLTREDLRYIVAEGLQTTKGSYKRLAQLFNLPEGDYKRFLNFLRKHGCQLPFRQYRGVLTEANDTE